MAPNARDRHQQSRPRIAAGRVPHLLLEAVELAPQRDTRRQQPVRNHLQAWMSGDQFSDPPLEARWRGWPDLETKAAQNAPQTQLEITKLCLQQFAPSQQCARLL